MTRETSVGQCNIVYPSTEAFYSTSLCLLWLHSDHISWYFSCRWLQVFVSEKCSSASNNLCEFPSVIDRRSFYACTGYDSRNYPQTLFAIFFVNIIVVMHAFLLSDFSNRFQEKIWAILCRLKSITIILDFERQPLLFSKPWLGLLLRLVLTQAQPTSDSLLVQKKTSIGHLCLIINYSEHRNSNNNHTNTQKNP